MNLTPAEVVNGLRCSQPDRASHPGRDLPRGTPARADDGQAGHAHRDGRRPRGVLQARHRAHRRPARRLPVAARREGPPQGRLARGLPVPGDLHAPDRRRGPDDGRGPRAHDARRVLRGGRAGAARRRREARPDVLRGAHAGLDRRARGRARRGAAADRRRLPEPHRPGAERQARPAPGRPDDHLRRRHREARRVRSPDWAKYMFWTVPKGVKLQDVELPESAGRLQHLHGPRAAARPDLPRPTARLPRRGPGPGHEERLHVLRRHPRGQGSARLLRRRSRSTRRSSRSTATRMPPPVRPPGPGRLRAAAGCRDPRPLARCRAIAAARTPRAPPRAHGRRGRRGLLRREARAHALADRVHPRPTARRRSPGTPASCWSGPRTSCS